MRVVVGVLVIVILALTVFVYRLNVKVDDFTETVDARKLDRCLNELGDAIGRLGNDVSRGDLIFPYLGSSACRDAVPPTPSSGPLPPAPTGQDALPDFLRGS